MNEQEWMTCADPRPMLEFVWGKASDRKFLLFRCACCRRFWNAMSEQPLLQNAVELVERHSEEQLPHNKFGPPSEASLFQQALHKAVSFALWPNAGDPSQVNRMACGRLSWLRVTPWNQFAGQGEKSLALLQQESLAQAQLLRDIFGTLPFRPVTVSPAWQTPNVVSLAQTIYDERAFDRMPILGDALEDAGCDNAEILDHCRQPGEHVRGCWVVDLILGKQ